MLHALRTSIRLGSTTAHLAASAVPWTSTRQHLPRVQELRACCPSMSTATARVAVGQMTATGDQQTNFSICSSLCKDARASGCCMLFLPECFSFIGLNQDQSRAAAQPLDGPLMQQYCQLARDHQLWLSLGGFQRTGPDPEHIWNCHLIVSSEGRIEAAYNKVHLFNVDVKNGPVLMESRGTAPGQQLVACDSPAGRLGLTVCYDLRFPEVFQRLAFEMGSQVLLVPSAFTRPTGQAHWELLLRARAVETQCYVIAAAQAGKHNEKRESWGHSIIVDPWGTVIAQLDDPDCTGVATADLDWDSMAALRERMPISEHRRQGRLCLGWDSISPDTPAQDLPAGVTPGMVPAKD